MDSSLALKRKKVNKLCLADISMLVMCVITVAFHNYHSLMVVSQVQCVVIIWTKAMAMNKCRITKSLFRYLRRGLMLIGFGALSALWAVNTGGIEEALIAMIQVLAIGSCVLLYLKSKSNYDKLILMLAVAGIALCIRILLQVPIYAWSGERIGQYIGYGNVGISNYLSFIAVFIIDWAIDNRNKIILACGIIMVAFATLSGSKKALLIAVIVYPLLILFKSRNPVQLLKRLLFIAALIVIIWVLITYLPLLYNTVGYRIQAMFDFINGTGASASTEVRWKLKLYALDQFTRHPIAGVGLDAFKFLNVYQRYAHDNYLEMLATLGIIGFVLYYWLFIEMTILSIKKLVIQKRREFAVVLAFLIMFFVAETASISYTQESIQIAVAMCFALITNPLLKGGTAS